MPNSDVRAPGTAPEPELDNDLEMLLGKIADQLAELSCAEELPSGFGVSPDPFDADDVAFDSSSWLMNILEVQAWLYLDETIEDGITKNATEIAQRVFLALGTEDQLQCFEEIDGLVRPTLVGADALASRCDSAIYLQHKYDEFRERLTRRQASDAWVELWEEEPSDAAPVEPIRATTKRWAVQEFSDKARKGKLNLSPTYQRGDVWPTGHSQLLVISILRGIPLPSVVLLKPQVEGAGGTHEVVDGKQRLTSILRFIGKHPDALRLVDEADQMTAKVGFRRLFEKDYKKFRRLWKTHRGESLTAKKEAEYYFPFRLPSSSPGLKGALEDLQGKYFYEIRDLPIQIGAEQETVADVFETVSEYKIPVIEYMEATPRQVHEVFHLYNRQGKHLTAEEIRNALFHELNLMRLLLVASGDNSEVKALAPYIPEDQRQSLQEIGETLTNYRFGTSRYKRTKLLSWLTALLFQPALQKDGSLLVRSTARHIDEMLLAVNRDIEARRVNRLESESFLTMLIGDLHRCLEAHSSCEVWAPEFQDDKDGSKWQELQLVASLVGTFLVGVVEEDSLDALEDAHESLKQFTTEHLRPAKTQNKTQWGFIGKVALGMLDVCGIDLAELETKLDVRYGRNCLPTLMAAAVHYHPRD